MNDMDFLGIVENIRKGLLFLFNSSFFWVFTGLYCFSFVFNQFKRELTSPRRVSRVTKSKKSWCYDE